MSYYECHITMAGDRDRLRRLVTAIPGWKFSAIDGDPVLGEGVKCYATTFYPLRLTLPVVVARVRLLADDLEQRGAKILRRKVEQVVYDDRSTKTDCDGACPECVAD